MGLCLEHISSIGFGTVELEVSNQNSAAVALYNKFGFTPIAVSKKSTLMKLQLSERTQMSIHRDHNHEIRDTPNHRYAYSFDFDVMHRYMIEAFRPFFIPGNFLELGSFRGDFTRRILLHFSDVTCVDASGDALCEARSKLGERVTYIHSAFENLKLLHHFDNVAMTHVLEHLDDPVGVLRRVNNEWLSDKGRFFLVCPNGNAPSRQIAVKMGLLSHNAAVTPSESEHGHRRTYTLDTLERDAISAGLKVIHRSGIFFKALANFQWDRLLQTDIITEEYLDGCYKLGQNYPDLCSSIFLLCERGDQCSSA